MPRAHLPVLLALSVIVLPLAAIPSTTGAQSGYSPATAQGRTAPTQPQPSATATLTATGTTSTPIATLPATATLITTPTATVALTATIPPTPASTGVAPTPVPTVTAPPSATSTASPTPVAGVTPTAPATPSATATVGITPTATPPAAASPITATLATLNAATGVTATGAITVAAYGRLPLSFEPNRGQAAAAVQYVSHGPGFTLFLTGSAATLAVRPQPRDLSHLFDPDHGMAASAALTQTTPITEADLRLRFNGVDPTVQPSGGAPLPGVASYLIGSDPSGWHTNIPTYGQVTYPGLYPGIDLVYYGTQGQLEYDWRVAPGADPGAISFTVDGAQGLSVDRRGNLLLQTGIGILEQRAPVAYQEENGQRHSVAASYALDGTTNTVHFSIGAYDPSQPLIIDPVLSYSTYLGGSRDDTGSGITVDTSGDAYVVGSTSSSNFPTQSGLHMTNAGASDVFVSKLNPSGTALVYSTYLGGSGTDYGDAIAVDGTGDAYLTGYTYSSNFPTQNAAQAAYNGNIDAFVTELNPAGNGLVYSTYLGGNNQDFGNGVALDGAGDAYVVGQTYSTTFPTANALQGTCNGCSNASNSDAFITKLNPSGGFLYSTYLGGNAYDYAQAVAVDGNGNAYVTGGTNSTTFPTQTPVQASSGGAYDAFVSKLSADGSVLLYSTYLGGGGNDDGYGIALDAQGDAYLTGKTQSTNFPTQNALYATNGGGTSGYDAFVAQLNTGGDALVYATYLGGNGDDVAYAIAVDGTGDAYVTGQTFSTNFPTANALQSTCDGCTSTSNSDAFVTEVASDDSALIFSTYLGGSSTDTGAGIAVDAGGGIYVTGQTASTDFPTATPLQASYGGGGYWDAFVTKLTDTTACPAGWACDDIGDPTLVGDQTLASGVWTLHGSGTDIASTSDQFHYVSQDVAGDSSIIARLTSQQDTGGCAKAGVMYRASTDAGAVNYSVVLLPHCRYTTSSVQVNYRAAPGGGTIMANDVPVSLPIYLKAVRTGNTFAAYTSGDGVTWTAIANASVSLPSMPPTALVGMAVTSANAAASGAATFDNVSLTGIADMEQLDTTTEHYTQTVDSPTSPTDLQVFSGPAAAAGDSGWQPISLTLTSPSGTGVVSPTLVPFGLQLAPTGTNTTVATLTAEDGITLGVGLASPAPGVTGQVSGSAVTYSNVFTSTGTMTSTVDDSVQGTGLDQFDYVGSTWVHCTAPPSGSNCSPTYYNDTNSASHTLNDYATFAFTGTAVTYYATEDTNRGYAAVSLDGGSETLVDLYSATQRGNIPVYTRTGLSGGTHTLKIRVSGQKDAASSNISVAIDRVDVATGTPAASDLSLRATAAGVDARIVVHSATASGPFVFTLVPSGGSSLVQDMGGTVRVTQVMTDAGDNGAPTYSYTETGITIQPPVATDSSNDPAAPVETGPATATLTSGGQALTVTIDPTWLHAAGRVFPVAVDLPIATINSTLRSGLFGTINSCAPTTPAPPTDVIVGVSGGCTYRGVSYFDLSSLASIPATATVTAATLWLYTPSQTGTTGVQVYANSGGSATPAQPPSWNSAPPIASGASGIAQSGSAGHWQKWDVTSLIQQWAQDGTTNGGVTLESSGAPVRFASPAGGGTADPAIGPYLDISLAVTGTAGGSGMSSLSPLSPNAVAPAGYNASTNPYYDTATFIYGEAGSYTADSLSTTGLNVLPSEAGGCSANGITCGSGQFRLSAAHHNIGAQYVRFSVQLACNSYTQHGIANPSAPGPAWWDTSDARPLYTYTDANGSHIVDADPNNIGDTLQLLLGAVSYHLIPIVVLQGNGQCPADMTPAMWQSQVEDFVTSYLYSYVGYPTSAPIYFEIGNEPNLASPQPGAGLFSGNVPLYTNDPLGFYGNTPNTYHFPSVFAYAARGLQAALQPTSNAYKYTQYRILTGGMFAPSSNTNPAICNGQNNVFDFYDDVFSAGQAINAAVNSGAQIPGPVVPRAHLGVAVHPYGYTLPRGSGFFKNYYTLKDTTLPAPQQTRGYSACQDIGGMLRIWSGAGTYHGSTPAFSGQSYNFQGLPVFISEVNYQAGKIASNDHNVVEGAYLADLFTWLYDQKCQRYKGRCDPTRGIDPSLTPLRVTWFRGVDSLGDDDLGLYDIKGNDKDMALPFCRNHAIKKTGHSLAHNYYYLRNGACY